MFYLLCVLHGLDCAGGDSFTQLLDDDLQVHYTPFQVDHPVATNNALLFALLQSDDFFSADLSDVHSAPPSKDLRPAVAERRSRRKKKGSVSGADGSARRRRLAASVICAARETAGLVVVAGDADPADFALAAYLHG